MRSLVDATVAPTKKHTPLCAQFTFVNYNHKYRK